MNIFNLNKNKSDDSLHIKPIKGKGIETINNGHIFHIIGMKDENNEPIGNAQDFLIQLSKIMIENNIEEIKVYKEK